MMKLLIMTGPLYPRVGNNANLLSKLFPFLKEKHEVMLLSPAFGASESELPETVFGCPIRWVTDHGQGWKRKLLYPAASKLKHDPGLEGEIGAKLIEEAAADMTGGFVMNRLVQGDVGSGKTLVAAALCWLCRENGYVSAESRVELVGCTGRAETELRPSGRALVAGQPVDVVSEGAFIGKGTAVVVVSVNGSRVVVREKRVESAE